MDELREELYSLIGRTVILFQRYEHTFKFLLIRSLIVGTADTLKENFDVRSQKIQKKSLGQLVALFKNEIVKFEDNTDFEDSDIDNTQFRFRVSIIFDSFTKDEIDSKYKFLVDERNFVIHHLISELTPGDALSYRAMLTKLSAINHKFEVDLKNLLSINKAMSDTYNQILGGQTTKQIL
ncbi:MAG: hypothetical protein COA34_006265 [Methylophaga sp.]|uniref:hypothetical protein n=1 Tax=Methylophaga sp. TaxID=2024840 RepID=UPI000C0CC447|nr:hypothetical protein [Methylophaga sp.]MBL1457460.1 hypothetical protein [Methylophaga sp.]